MAPTTTARVPATLAPDTHTTTQTLRDLTGTARPHSRGFAFVDLHVPTSVAGTDITSVFVPPTLARDLLDGDTVTVTAQAGTDGRLAATDITVTTRDRRHFFVTLTTVNGTLTAVCDPHLGSKTWPVTTTSCPDVDGTPGTVRAGMAALVSVRDEQATPVRAHSDLDSTLVLRTRVLERHQITLEHPSDALDQARQVAADGIVTVPGTTRRDQRHLRTLTIDADHSRDLDDALSIIDELPDGTTTIGVHIADVASVVTPGTPLDVEAARTATSVYLPGLVRPMFPHTLSDDALSLLPGRDRGVLTCQFTVTPTGSVSDISVYPSTIRSDQRQSYVAVANLLNTGHDDRIDEDTREDLLLLGQVAERIQAVRATREHITVNRSEPSLHVTDVDGQVTIVEAGDTTGEQIAHDLIETLMVTANECVAQWLAAAGSDVVYRVHDAFTARDAATMGTFTASRGADVGAIATAGDLAKVTRALDARDRATLEQLVMAALPRARYQSEPGSHFGLGSSAYAHFTSPIRRYADVLVHRLVYATLTGTEGPDRDQLDAACAGINDGAGVAARAEAGLRKAMWASVLDVQRSRVREATITGITPKGLNVTLTDSGVLAFLPTYRIGGRGWAANAMGTTFSTPGGATLRLGEKIKVRISAANATDGSIEVRLHGADRSGAIPAGGHRPGTRPASTGPRRRRRR